MKKILEFLIKKNRWAILLILILLLFGSIFIKIQRNKINEFKDKYQTEVKLKKALLDSVNIYQNNENEWVAEKLTIQATIKELKLMNGQLTNNQKELIDKINEINKDNSIITAALIHAKFIIDSLQHTGYVLVDTTNKTVEFIEQNNLDIRYNFLALGVLPYPKDSKPTLLIKNLILPNNQFIEFHWNENKKEGYPITFSVTNSNKYVKVYDINSYAIPELDKNIINPTNWERVGLWFKKNGKFMKYVAGGVVVGAGGTYILMK